MLIAASAQSYAQAVDCRSCHAPGGAPGAADISIIYANLAAHHNVGIEYPTQQLTNKSLNAPNGMTIDVTFFDKNLNDFPDIDEVQMFDAPPLTAVIECATCHMEHGDAPPVSHPPSYLRFRNTGSSLCTTCHNY